MSGDKIKSLVELANNRLNSSEDFEQFQTFVSQELDLDTVSIYLSYCYYSFVFHYNTPSIIVVMLCHYYNIILIEDSVMCKITQPLLKDYIHSLKLINNHLLNCLPKDYDDVSLMLKQILFD